jgi:hypothetical protein
MMEAICSSETSVLIKATWCHNPEDGMLHGKQIDWNANYRPVRAAHFGNKKFFRSREEKEKSGYGPQKRARHQERLAD